MNEEMFNVTLSGSPDGDNDSVGCETAEHAVNYCENIINEKMMDVWMDGGKRWFDFISKVENEVPCDYEHGGIVISFE